MNDAEVRPRPSPALIAEATKRAGLIWVQAPGRNRPLPLWHLWLAGRQPGAPGGPGQRVAAPAVGAAYVLTGPGEQDLPELAQAARVTVVTPANGVPGAEESGGLVTWDAEVSRIEPGGADWDEVIGPLLAGRLNPALDPGETSPADRWRRTCVIYRLTPAGA